MKRETSSYERVMFHYSGKGPMYFAFRLNIRGNLTLERLLPALEKVRLEFPLTAVRVEKLADKRQFITTENVPEYPLSVIDPFSGDWHDELISLLQPPFDNAVGPMVRFKLLRNGLENSLIAVFHHAVGDGVGSVLFLESLLRHLGDPERPEAIPTEETWAPMLHKIISPENMKIIETFDPPEFKNNKEYTHYVPKINPSEPFPILPFALHTVAFTEEETGRIVTAAKLAGVTVHAYLGAMILQCFATEFGPSEGYLRTIQSPINFRPQLIPGADRMFGLFNGLLTADSDCSEGRPTEEIAREIGKSFHDEIQSLKPLAGYYNFMSYILEGLDDPEVYYDSREKNGPDMKYDFSFSNLGRIEMERDFGDLELVEAFGPVFSATRGEKVIGALTLQGKLHMTMIYDSDCFNRKTGDRIWLTIKEKILALPAGTTD
jgi:NRPS condensation-like uncharacterized protein